MSLSKKLTLLGLGLILIVTSFTMFSFANEEKDYINQALKLIDEKKYNEAVRELLVLKDVFSGKTTEATIDFQIIE